MPTVISRRVRTAEQNRRRVLEHVAAHPGARLRDLCRTLNLHYGTAFGYVRCSWFVVVRGRCDLTAEGRAALADPSAVATVVKRDGEPVVRFYGPTAEVVELLRPGPRRLSRVAAYLGCSYGVARVFLEDRPGTFRLDGEEVSLATTKRRRRRV